MWTTKEVSSDFSIWFGITTKVFRVFKVIEQFKQRQTLRRPWEPVVRLVWCVIIKIFILHNDRFRIMTIESDDNCLVISVTAGYFRSCCFKSTVDISSAVILRVLSFARNDHISQRLVEIRIPWPTLRIPRLHLNWLLFVWLVRDVSFFKFGVCTFYNIQIRNEKFYISLVK